MIKNFYNYFKFFKNVVGWRMSLVVVLTFTAAVAESIGILLFIPVIGKFDASSEFASDGNSVIDIFMSIFNILKLDFTLQNFLLLISSSFILKGLLVFGSYVFSARSRGRLLYKLKKNILLYVQDINYTFFLRKDVGSLTTLLNEHVTKSLLCFNFFLNFTSHVLTSMLYVTMGMLASPILGVFGACMALFVLLLFKKLSFKLKTISHQNSILTGQITQAVIEGMHNYKYLKSTGLFVEFNRKIITFMTKLKRLNIYNGVAEGFVISVREPILAVTLCVILYIQVGILEGSIANSLVAMLLFYRAMNSVFSSQRTWQNFLEHAGSIDLIEEEVKAFSAQSERFRNRLELPSMWSTITFNDVSYVTPNENKVVLENLSFTIKRNSLNVIIGPSGSGKTTLADLLVGLLRPTTGSISIDDLDLSSINMASYRTKIGYVSQDNVAFSDTIANNVSSWNIDNDNNDTLNKRLRSACEKAKILDVITELSEGFNTKVGDRGTTFSGGQRQRLFLAREIYREPEILILDEPTSALDTETEQFVFDAIDELKGKVTIICISHRTSLVATADTVINLCKD